MLDISPCIVVVVDIVVVRKALSIQFIFYFIFFLVHFSFFCCIQFFFILPSYLPAMSSTSEIKYRFLYSLNIKKFSFFSFFSLLLLLPIFFHPLLCTCRPLILNPYFCLVLRNHHHSPPQKHTYYK